MAAKIRPALLLTGDTCSLSLLQESLSSLQEIFREKCSESFRIFCFTATIPDMGMWGHYADCHRGFVIEFNPSHRLFDDLKEVQYQEQRPEPKKVGDLEFLHIKDVLWQKEHEYRLIKKATDLEEGVRSDDKPLKPLRFVPLPAEAVKAVFFGWQMKPEIRKQMVTDLGRQNVQKFIMEPDISKYALREIPLDEWKPRPAYIERLIQEALRIRPPAAKSPPLTVGS
jgi:hypothetical protein